MSKLLFGLVGIIFLAIVGITVYSVMTQSTEGRNKAAIEEKIYKQWEFASDVEGWKPTNLVKYGVLNGTLYAVVGVDPRMDSASPAQRPFGSILQPSVGTTIPAGNKNLKISLAVTSANTPNTAKPTCIPRPACLDNKPHPCDIPERQDYCPQSISQYSFVIQYVAPNSTTPPKQLILNGTADGQQHVYSIRFPEVGELQIQSLQILLNGLSSNNAVNIDWIRLTGPLSGGGTTQSGPVIRQTYLNGSGDKLYGRLCHWNSDRGQAENCSAWDTQPVPPLLSTSSDKGARTYSGFAYNPNGLSPSDIWNVREMIMNTDGTTLYYRTCQLNPKSTIAATCTDTWHPSPLNNITGTGDKSYRSYGAFVFNTYQRNTRLPQSIRQFYLSENGLMTYYRTCQWDAARGSAEECNSWSSYPVPNLPPNSVPAVTRQYNAFLYQSPSSGGAPTQNVRQFFINQDGTKNYYRTCVWNANTASPQSCTPADNTWNSSDLVNITGSGDQSYRSYSAYVIGTP